MTVLGIDYGRVRLGLAVSDAGEIVAHPLPPIHRGRTDRGALHALRQLVVERDVRAVVVGLPRRMDGSCGTMANEVLAFTERLHEAVDRPVETFDERLTSVEADRILREGNVPQKRRRALRDGLAAVLILQAYLDAHRDRCGDAPPRSTDAVSP
jgi:putative Holliday junction resolvase